MRAGDERGVGPPLGGRSTGTETILAGGCGARRAGGGALGGGEASRHGDWWLAASDEAIEIVGDKERFWIEIVLILQQCRRVLQRKSNENTQDSHNR